MGKLDGKIRAKLSPIQIKDGKQIEKVERNRNKEEKQKERQSRNKCTKTESKTKDIQSKDKRVKRALESGWEITRRGMGNKQVCRIGGEKQMEKGDICVDTVNYNDKKSEY